MSKSKENEDTVTNSFDGFTVLQGKFVPEAPKSAKTEDKVDDDIISEDSTVSKDKDKEAERIAAGDKALEKVIEQKEALAKSKASKTEDEPSTEEEEEDSEDDDKTSDTEEDGLVLFTKHLHEKGVIDFDDTDEEFEKSEEGLEKLVNKTVQNRINKWVDALPEDYSKFLNYVQNGGKPKDFLDVYYGKHSWENFKVESEDAQKAAVMESLRLAGETEEDIIDIVTEWADNGSLEKRAKSAIVKLQKHEIAEKQAIVEQQKEYAEKQAKAEKEYWDNFKNELYSKEEIKGFKLSKKEKDNLWDFMSTVKKNGKTPYQEATEKEKDASLLFAYFAMKGFDVNKLEKQVETKVSNKLGNVLKNYSKTTKDKISGGRTNEDFDSNPFSGFKQK